MQTFFLKCAIALLVIVACNRLHAVSDTDSVFIRIHFLHGSTPKHNYRGSETRWFGGLLGGHAGIEFSPDQIINFVPLSRVHVLSHPHQINSRFAIHDTISFYEILGNRYDSVKKTMISIKISSAQKASLDSAVKMYREKCPYDYAFFGMRCGAAAYDILACSGIVKRYSYSRTWRKIFYPRRLRRKLERQACEKHYAIAKQPGTQRRRWEKD